LKLKVQLHCGKVLALSTKKTFPLGGAGGVGPPNVNLGPLISWKLLELESWI